MDFVFKSVNASSDIGADLQELRRQNKLTRSEAAEQTKIAEFLLRALEENAWEEISDPLYAERILRAYVKFLGGKEKYFLYKYRARLEEKQVKRKQEDLLPRIKKMTRLDLTVLSRWIAAGASLLIIVFLAGYLYLEARQINQPPPLAVFEPMDGQKLNEPYVRIRGKTLPESAVSVNYQTLVVRADGSFEGTFDVPRGTTLLVIRARRRHGEIKTEARRVVFDKPLPNLTSTNATSTASTSTGL